MKAIGLRVVSNSKIFYTIIDQDEENLTYLTVSCLFVPLSMAKPDRFNFVRNTILDIVDQYNIKKAAIKVSEHGGTLNGSAIERYYLEGVIQESIASSVIDNYIAGRMGTLSSKLKITPTLFRQMAQGEQAFTLIPADLEWARLCSEERESILACHAALKIN